MTSTLRSGPLLAACTALLVWLACASTSREIDLSGTSETTVTVSRAIRFKATGPVTFPDAYPGIGGLSLAPGVEIDVTLEPGESITLDDVTDAAGNITVTGVAEVDQRSARAATPVPSQPKPAGTVTLDATIHSTSTYTWRVPSLFGDTPATVPVTGAIHAVVAPSALIDDGAGGGSLDPAGIQSLSYQVSGPPAVWQAPIETPYGTITGTGTIATEGPMLLELSGALTAVSGAASAGHIDPDGIYWDYHYTGAYPVQLTVGTGAASGATTVEGGLDLH